MTAATSPGPGVDAQGVPVIDPTANVLALVEAAIRRQDDLREQEAKYTEQLAALRARHAADMQDKETARIDAIRAVDVGAVSRAAEVSAVQASTLAAQVATSAETLRGQVAAAASASTIALAAALEPIQKSIDDLRRVQYEQQGQRTGQAETKGTNQWVVGFIVSLIFLMVALGSLIVVLATKK